MIKFFKKHIFMVSFVCLQTFVFIIWLAWKIFYIKFDPTLWEYLSKEGDSFGTLNTLFSGFAFAGMMMTIIFQSIELKEQRIELKGQRKELKGQKEELEIQNKTAELQRFDSSFFNLLSSFREYRDRIFLEYNNEKYIGTRCIYFLYDQLKDDYDSMFDITYIIKTSEYKVLIQYFIFIYRILKFIDEYELRYNNGEIRSIYIGILMSNLSLKEFTLLYYHTVSFEEMKLLVEKYHIWGSIFLHGKQDITVGDIIFSSNDRELYNDVAFSANSDTGTVSDNTVE